MATMVSRGIYFDNITDPTTVLLHFSNKNKRWILPGGRLYDIEDNLTALKRRFGKETGLTVTATRFLFHKGHYQNNILTTTDYFFLIETVDDHVIKEISTSPQWFPIKKLPKMPSYQKRIIVKTAAKLQRGQQKEQNRACP